MCRSDGRTRPLSKGPVRISETKPVWCELSGQRYLGWLEWFAAVDLHAQPSPGACAGNERALAVPEREVA